MSKNKGFTIIELFIVIVFIAIVTSVVAPNLQTRSTAYDKFYAECLEDGNLEVHECKLNAKEREKLQLQQLEKRANGSEFDNDFN